MPDPKGAVLHSWKEIAAHLKRDVRTVQRWETIEGLPVYRHAHLARSSVYAYSDELDRWWANRRGGVNGTADDATGKRIWKRPAVLLAVAGLTASAWMAAVWTKEPSLLVTRPLTAAIGLESYPNFSPDGQRVAYVWKKPGEEGGDIYLKSLARGDATPVTSSPSEPEMLPTFSPDGLWIAFFAIREGIPYLMVVPSAGGNERRVHPERWEPNGGLAWTPDGLSLIAPLVEKPKALPVLHVLSVATGERRKLLAPPPSEYDLYPAISADGQTLAFVRMGNFGILRRIHLARLSASIQIVGDPVALNLVRGSVQGVAWIGKEKRLLYTVGYSASGTTAGFWSIRMEGTEAPRLVLPLPGIQVARGSLSPDGRSLVYYALQTADTGFWRINLAGNPAVESPATELPSAPVVNLNIDLSPDGRSIAYASNRSGGLEIWTSWLDGSQARQVTDRPGEKSGTPRWSPDGSRIAFDSSTAGNADVFVVGSSGGMPLRLTANPAVENNVSWSRDGRWLYFGSNRTGEFQIWKIPVSGGQETQLTRRGGFGGVESPLGDYFYYTTEYQGGELRRVPLWGGDEETIYPRIRNVHELRATRRGVYFLAPCPECNKREKPHVLWRYLLPNGPVEEAGRFRLAVRMGLAVAPDDTFVVVNGIRPPRTDTRNVMLAEGLP